MTRSSNLCAVKAPRSGNLAQATYEQIRHSIVLGDLRPNQRLVEASLAAELDVSRTPVRESLQRLASEGLVESRSYGWVVRELSLDEVRQIYEVREVLEGLAARQAAHRADEAQQQALSSAVQRDRSGLVAPNRRTLVENNEVLHKAIFEASGNDLLMRELERVNAYHFNFVVAAAYTAEEVETSIGQHGAIVEAVLAGAGERAEKLMRSHIQWSWEAVMRHSF